MDINWFLAISFILFGIGIVGVLLRRNAIVVFMCVELMLNAVNLSLVGFSLHHANSEGMLLVLFVFGVAAAEAIIGLSIILAYYRKHNTILFQEK